METHGYSKRGEVTATYRTWLNMKNRCLNPFGESFKDYGGRGITVCEKWMRFEGFLEDMGNKPSGLTLERKDNNKGYYKDNCKWATMAEQTINQRTRIDNKLGHKNIRLKKGAYQVRLQRRGEPITVGSYSTLEAAIEARDNYIEGT